MIAPGERFPGRWEDDHGQIRIMCEPVEGYVMARRKGAMPFVISVRDLLSGRKIGGKGPFHPLGSKRKSE